MEQLGAHRNSRVIWVTHSSLQVCPAEIARVNAAGGCVLWGRVQVRQGRGDRVRVLESRWFHRHSFSLRPPVIHLSRHSSLAPLALIRLHYQGCLAVSRAFGDRSLQPYVIADPYISCRPINLDQVGEWAAYLSSSSLL